MRVFVTGASGWIGSAAVADLIAGGHEVTGLARSNEAADRVAALGAQVVRGRLDDLDTLRSAAAAADAVVHLGYNHDFSQMGAAAQTDRTVIEAFGDALAGTDKPFLIASGVVGLVTGRPGTEQDQADPSTHPRVANAAFTLSLADRGIRSGVVRFSPTVHGAGDHGFVAVLVATARKHGVSAYIGEGSNRWPAVHRLDAGHLVRLGVEQSRPGAVLHAVAEQGVPTREIAEAIGRGLGLPVESIPAERAAEHFDWLGMFFGMDVPSSSEITREAYGWDPTGPTLIDDLDSGAYFAE